MSNEAYSDAAKIGKMFVTSVEFSYQPASQEHIGGGKYKNSPGRWNIQAKLADKPERYSSNVETMTFTVEQGIGEKLIEVLLPVIVADASRKAQELANQSKEMVTALADRVQKCITEVMEPPVDGK